MDRLTAHSESNGTPVPNRDTIGDLCMKMDWCLDYDFCEGCPVRAMIDRLCEYEDTGMTPEEIMKLKGKKNTAKVRRYWLREQLTAVHGEVFLSDEKIIILI